MLSTTQGAAVPSVVFPEQPEQQPGAPKQFPERPKQLPEQLEQLAEQGGTGGLITEYWGLRPQYSLISPLDPLQTSCQNHLSQECAKLF